MPISPQETTVFADDGTEYRITIKNGRFIEIWTPGGDQMLILPSSVTNKVVLAPWPDFEPVIPASREQPVRVSRDLVMEVMSPRANGVSMEVVEAVQNAVDTDTIYRELLAAQIKRTLTKRNNGRYETVLVRNPNQEA